MKPFWITSMGRTGTKWLATQLRVPHEPKEDPQPFRAVSPKHLEKWLVEEWRPRPQDSTDIAVIVRDARQQALSAINRFHAVHPDPVERIKRWVSRVPQYLVVIQELIDRGAVVIDYHRMTTQKEYLARIAERFGCRLDPSQFEKRINAHRKRDHELTAAHAALATVMQEHYDRWLNQHAM